MALLDTLSTVDPARDLDVLSVGRVGLDLYARERDTDFADVSGFEKHVGGSPGLIALGVAKLGKRAAILSRVSDDMVGRYVVKRLEAGGVETSGVSLDASGTRTSLAITEMRAEGCGVVIYRNDAADLALSPDDVSEELVRRARVLVVSGTALSREPSRGAAFEAIHVAARAGIPVAIDLDYRAYTWRSVEEARDTYRSAADHASILIGNREEFEVLGVAASASAADVGASCLGGATELVLVKAGGEGSDAFLADGSALRQSIFPVEVSKPFGAGDAYAASVLAALLDGRPLADALRRGAAAAAIVVAGVSCDEAMPSMQELDTFLDQHRTPEP